MSYKIAVASSSGLIVDETFGSTNAFLIYEAENGRYQRIEERAALYSSIQKACDSSIHCETEGGCLHGAGRGCAGTISSKVELISDCRCIVCKKIGFQIQKQLERKAITTFDVNCSVEEALHRITEYYSRVDHHESLGHKDTASLQN